MNRDEEFMQRCFELAEQARAEGESPVGSILVKDNQILGEGSEKSKQLGDITRHAEVVALLHALKKTDRLKGATLYTNVEPCMLCSYVIRHHGIKRVVFAQSSGELGGTSQPYHILSATDIASWGDPPEIEKWESGEPQ